MMLEYVQDCQASYDDKMEQQVLRRSATRRRTFKIGDLVMVFKKIGGRTRSKLSRTKDGPYEITALPGPGQVNTYKAKLVGGTGKTIALQYLSGGSKPSSSRKTFLSFVLGI